MSTTTTAPANAKINTIQPIEGARGNIALYYYQGKYPIYKSLDDDMYHLKSVIDAFKGSSKVDTKKCDIFEWKKLDSTGRLINHLSKPGYPGSEPLCKKRQQNVKMQYLDGWYGCEILMLDLAGWLDKGFHCEIYDVFAMSAERDRLNADIDHKQSTIEELKLDIAHIKEQNDKLLTKNDQLIAKNDELLQINRDQTDTLNKMRKDMKAIKASAESIAPIASSLKNRVSSPLSEEYLLVNLMDDNGTIASVYYKAVNPNTIKKERIDVNSFWIHQSFANSVDAQNRLIDRLQSDDMIVKLDRRAKTFTIRSYHLAKLRSIIENDLMRTLNVESKEITEEAIDIRDKSDAQQSTETYKGYPKDYCLKICDCWKIDMETLSAIIDRKRRYGKYPIRLHPTEGLCYRRSVNGKSVYYKLPIDAFV